MPNQPTPTPPTPGRSRFNGRSLLLPFAILAAIAYVEWQRGPL